MTSTVRAHHPADRGQQPARCVHAAEARKRPRRCASGGARQLLPISRTAVPGRSLHNRFLLSRFGRSDCGSCSMDMPECECSGRVSTISLVWGKRDIIPPRGKLKYHCRSLCKAKSRHTVSVKADE